MVKSVEVPASTLFACPDMKKPKPNVRLGCGWPGWGRDHKSRLEGKIPSMALTFVKVHP